MSADAVAVEDVATAVYRFPTAGPEQDGTLRWDATVAVTVQVTAGGRTGLGWTYSSPAAAGVITHHLAPALTGRDAFDVDGAFLAMRRACRNLGTKGLVMQAVSAVDIALWDLKARLLDRPLDTLLGRVRDRVPVYGSGGFVNLDHDQLADEVAGWQAVGCTAMKIKIGSGDGADVGRDFNRVQQVRALAGDRVELMVDANGAYGTGSARRVGAALESAGVSWFEEPVSSDDTDGLQEVRRSLLCDVAAGEYISDTYDAERLVPVVDCLQLDVTRCGGYTGWRRAAAVAGAHNRQVSGHCAPSLHAWIGAATPHLRHVEYFVDHARLEPLLVDGRPEVTGGALRLPDGVVGHGMTLAATAARFRTG